MTWKELEDTNSGILCWNTWEDNTVSGTCTWITTSFSFTLIRLMADILLLICCLNSYWKCEKGYSKFIFQFLIKSFAINLYNSEYFCIRLKKKSKKVIKYTERTIWERKNLLWQKKFVCFLYWYTAGKEALSAGCAEPSLEYTKKSISSNTYLFRDWEEYHFHWEIKTILLISSSVVRFHIIQNINKILKLLTQFEWNMHKCFLQAMPVLLSEGKKKIVFTLLPSLQGEPGVPGRLGMPGPPGRAVPGPKVTSS